MNDEMDYKPENETNAPVTPPSSDNPMNEEPVTAPNTNPAPQDTSEIPKVEATPVYTRPIDNEFSVQPQTPNAVNGEFTRMENRYSPYGAREYRPNPTPNTLPNGYGNPAYTSPVQPVQQNIEPKTKKKKGHTGLKVFAIVLAVVLVFTFVLGFFAVAKFLVNKNGGENPINTPSALADASNAPTFGNDEHVTPPMPEDALSTPEIAAKVKPSIVGIVVYAGGNSSTIAGEGTGVIWEEDATKTYTYIITCAHVISDSGITVKVQTEDGSLYDAEIVGLDKRTDLGVVRIKATGMPKAEFGDSDTLRVGDNVFAIGNPGGVEFFGSFTGGYISAIDRPVDSEIGYTMKCIQHDAAINPGNSGGALVNVYGQVIGINSQKIAATEYEGMGFAIPMASAKVIIEQLAQYGYVPDRPKLGISYYPVSASPQYSIIAQYQGLPAGTLIIDSIDDDSALANTAARRYDMIIAVNGQNLTTPDVLLNLIESSQVGTKMKLTLCRVNNDYTVEKFDIEITLVEDKSGAPVQATEPDYVDPFAQNNPYGY